ncbi:gamma-type small acid-soluble spore protein [Sporosarcina sp. PTS2304]|uniref:gamma-type small acid-soluble spore protein n=1 Tax=Sporosarcina sp. PTS2304 TaxID=2283194 RepID=UPI000E0CD965|nr:gamma-type small acid-soluble spore protein [Sporosarcina sp. PTS2304]AXH99928.1 gamma-type small acid-soluble spore protein [Sporosarcina sp. PTS2304]
MPKQPNQNSQYDPSKTDAKKVRQQNAQSAMQQPMNEEFASETDVNQVRQQNAQSAMNMQSASAPSSMNEEFASETDVNEVRKQIQQAEANKKNASSNNANRNKGSY